MISTFLKRFFFIFILSWCNISLCDIVTGATILTSQALTPIEKINVGDYVIGYENNALITNQVIQISVIKIDTIVTIKTNQEAIQATKNQLFYDPCINQWIKAKDLTINNILLNSNLENCSCHNITIASQTTIAYKISTPSPHNFFISNAQILTHNAPPVAIGIAWAFGAGIKFSGITLGALFGGTMIGINLLNKNKNNVITFGLETETITSSGNYNPDPNDNHKEKQKNNIFESIKLHADKKARSNRFGNFYRDPQTKLWWSKDRANHGGSAFKVFKESTKGLEWIFDADETGSQIIGKHKGPTGLFISHKDLILCQ